MIQNKHKQKKEKINAVHFMRFPSAFRFHFQRKRDRYYIILAIILENVGTICVGFMFCYIFQSSGPVVVFCFFVSWFGCISQALVPAATTNNRSLPLE